MQEPLAVVARGRAKRGRREATTQKKHPTIMELETQIVRRVLCPQQRRGRQGKTSLELPSGRMVCNSQEQRGRQMNCRNFGSRVYMGLRSLVIRLVFSSGVVESPMTQLPIISWEESAGMASHLQETSVRGKQMRLGVG